MGTNRRIAVADTWNDRISVFSLKGEFVRHVGVGVLLFPFAVACSVNDNELVVADWGNNRVVVFCASGEVLRMLGWGHFRGAAIHADAIFAQREGKCVVFT
jgi:hypothetical protein